MKHAQAGARRLQFRLDYLLYFTLLYPLVFLWLGFSKALGKRYTDDIRSKKNIFLETSSTLHAALPWVYYL